MRCLGDVLGASGGPLRAVLGPAGGLGGYIWGKDSACEFGLRLLRPYSGPLGGFGALLGGFLGCMEALWDRLGILLGRLRLSWAILEASWGALGSRKPEKARTRESLEKKRREISDFWLLELSWESSRSLLGASYGTSWSILSVYGVICERSSAI